MRFFLLKSEPEVFSWDDLLLAGTEPWTGVRNSQAAAVLRAMAEGDRAFFYHSNTGREVMGVMEVARTAYPDPSAACGRWVCVDVRPLWPLPRPVPLTAIKAEPRLANLPLVRQARLSCMAVEPAHWEVICGLGGNAP